MPSKIKATMMLATIFLGSVTLAQAQKVPDFYPASYAETVAAAKKEGSVVIYSPTDSEQANALISAFQAAYPGIKVDYNDLSNNAIYSRVISEDAAKQVGSDIVWSVGLDLQVRLVEDGLAQAYESPEAKSIPATAQYKNTAYLTSIEPGVILYNKRLLKAEMVPDSLGNLTELMTKNPAVFKGKVASWDPEKSGQGYVVMQDELRNNPGFWKLMAAFGAADGKIYSNSGQMREKIVSGEQLVGFYVNGAYAAGWVKANPSLAIVYAKDRTSAVSRAAFITKGAPHPNAAKLLLDYMLSAAGQTVMAKSGLPSVRSDVEGVSNFVTLNREANGKLHPIALDAKLLDNLDKDKRAEFFQKWRAAMGR